MSTNTLHVLVLRGLISQVWGQQFRPPSGQSPGEPPCGQQCQGRSIRWEAELFNDISATSSDSRLLGNEAN